MLELGEKVELNEPIGGPRSQSPELLFFMTRFPIAQAGRTLAFYLRRAVNVQSLPSTSSVLGSLVCSITPGFMQP